MHRVRRSTELQLYKLNLSLISTETWYTVVTNQEGNCKKRIERGGGHHARFKAPSVKSPSFKNRVKLNIAIVYVCEDCCCSLFIIFININK